MRWLHVLLLLAVAYTDLAHRRVYRWWTFPALAVGVIAACGATYPWLHGAMGAAMFGYGFWGWRRGLWGGGDVWLLTYLGLILGVGVAPALLVALALVGVLLLAKRLQWGQTIPLAAFLAAGALAVLLWPAGALPTFESALSTGAYTVQLSPLPTPTPDGAAALRAQEAACAVARIGLTPPESRPAQAQTAAITLRALAAQAPSTDQSALLAGWATALDAYAAGKGTTTAITHFSALNREYWREP